MVNLSEIMVINEKKEGNNTDKFVYIMIKNK